MQPRNGAVVGLLLLATCSEELGDRGASPVEPRAKAIGTIPPTEVAVWQKVGASNLPDGRYLQAAAFDETRRVLVLFGGMTADARTGSFAASRETWEWSPTTGAWTNRTAAGAAPDARSGASMVFDATRGKLILFGGRAGSGFDLEDTWEWDPTTGAWSNVTASGNHPTARSQHGMVYAKSTGKVLLFGGGRSQTSDSSGIYVTASLGDTWEYDPATYTWTPLTTATAPSMRHDFGLVWDSLRSKAVLFGGMQSDIPNAAGSPKQDTWEWDPATSTWTERTTTGSKPSQRFAHAMAFDGKRGKVLLFGGLDMSTGGSRNDLWELDPATFAWTQRLAGDESGTPAARMYSALVSDDGSGVLELVAGMVAYDPYATGGAIGVPLPIPLPVGPGYGMTPTRDVWELDPAKPGFKNRSAALDVPSSRFAQTMAYSPATDRTYLFGGCDFASGQPFGDLWEWDGKVWTLVAVDKGPLPRCGAALAYDPTRKSMILFGGGDLNVTVTYNDTWELDGNRRWTQLAPTSTPDELLAPAMVTDTMRGKILLFGGMHDYGTGRYGDPMSNEVWEWDGKSLTWTNRTPPSATNVPAGRALPLLTYDEGRQRMFLYDGMSYGPYYTGYSEWDPITAGWVRYDLGEEMVNGGAFSAVAYDAIRRRQVLVSDFSASPTGQVATVEIDTKSRTVYQRATASSPGGGYGSSMAFDSSRGVVVLYGGQDLSTGISLTETWEYKVSNLGNGEGCTGTFASSCASGFCVDGVCCDVGACTGACRSCSVAGSEGTCVLAAPGTEVPGSCAAGKSCDATGTCKTKNGQTCALAADCASGFCVDGVCCDGACAGPCVSCNQAGREGRCTSYAAGTDPQSECGEGTGACKSTCDGSGACAFPDTRVTCGDCLQCNGVGDCSVHDYINCPWGGSGGYIPNFGGSGGYIPNLGGSGGHAGGAGGRPNPSGGSGGLVPNLGGSGGSRPMVGGAAGSIPGGGGSGPMVGGAAGSLPGGGGGSIPRSDGSAGSLAGYGGVVPGSGGGSGTHDGAAGDAGGTALHKSGCSCALGGRGRSAPSAILSLLPFGAAWTCLRRRRRRVGDGEGRRAARQRPP